MHHRKCQWSSIWVPRKRACCCCRAGHFAGICISPWPCSHRLPLPEGDDYIHVRASRYPQSVLLSLVVLAAVLGGNDRLPVSYPYRSRSRHFARASNHARSILDSGSAATAMLWSRSRLACSLARPPAADLAPYRQPSQRTRPPHVSAPGSPCW